jgi:hypothetical protein
MGHSYAVDKWCKKSLHDFIASVIIQLRGEATSG